MTIELSWGSVGCHGYRCRICGDDRPGGRIFTIRDGSDGKGPSLCARCVHAIMRLVHAGGGSMTIVDGPTRWEAPPPPSAH